MTVGTEIPILEVSTDEKTDFAVLKIDDAYRSRFGACERIFRLLGCSGDLE
jgi:hypothetical protein